MKTALLLVASVASFAACSVYDTPPEQSARERGGIVGHRGGVAVYGSEGDLPNATAAAGASITDVGRSDSTPPANAPAAAPATAPAPPAPGQPTGTATPAPACEPGQTDCAPPTSAAPPVR